MSGPLFHVGATAMCPHGGQVTVVSSNTRVFASAQAVSTIGDTYTIAGCPFTVPPGKPQPCVMVRWAPTPRVLVNGVPVVTQGSAGMCFSAEQIPQGPPSVIATQVRAVTA